ncbi:MAG: hypothetical protein ABEI52_07180 [Halobacteriaceae archaeon]
MVEYASIRIEKDLKQRLDEELKASETRNQQIERLLDRHSNDTAVDLSPVLQRLDDLETSIPNDVVEEFQARQRR